MTIRAIIGILLVVLLSACSRGSTATTPESTLAAPLEIEAAAARVITTADTVQVVGSFLPLDRVLAPAEVAGTVAELLVDLGDTVRAGDVVARLEPHRLTLQVEAQRAALAQAKAVLERARANRERSEELYRKKILQKEMLDNATSEWRVAEANAEVASKQLSLAEENLSHAVIRSPLNGFVVMRHTAVGQYVTPGQPVMELVAVDPLKLRLDVPERAAGAVREGQVVHIEVESVPGERFTGSVVRVSAVLDSTTRTLPIICFVPNPETRLKPGMFTHATIQLGERAAIVVPRAAVDTFAGSHRAFTIESDGSVAARAVKLGADLGAEVIIEEGIEAGESVAVSHLERLADGVRVQVATKMVP